MYPHRIRLRGPWEAEPVARMVRRADGTVETLEEPVPPRTRMTLPRRWHEGGLENFAGRVRFRRRFGYPGRIAAQERVWLTFAGASETAEIWLNGRLLGQQVTAATPFEFEITELLQVRNELVVQVDAPDGQGGLWGEVALEVRATAFLRAVRAWTMGEDKTAALHVAGEVVGTSERPLELYVLVDGATRHYALVEPAAGGQPFHVTLEGLGDKPDGVHNVRVDLVNGATLWYVVERFI